MIDDLFTSGWTVQSKTQARDEGRAKKKATWSTTSSISGCMRTLGMNEQKPYGKTEVYSTHRFYTSASNAVTDTQRLLNPDGEIYSVLYVENPHGLDEFLQVDCVRGQLEKSDE